MKKRTRGAPQKNEYAKKEDGHHDNRFTVNATDDQSEIWQKAMDIVEAKSVSKWIAAAADREAKRIIRKAEKNED